MELIQVIENRTSIRKFKDEKIPVDDLKEMVRLAGCAPSPNNSQSWKFIAITNHKILSAVAGLVNKKIESLFPVDENERDKVKQIQVEKFSTFFEKAPVLIAVVTYPYTAVADNLIQYGNITHEDLNRMRNYPDIQSVGAAVENLLLAAVNLGYGGCWLSGLMVAKDEIEKLLNIKEPYSLSACVALGKPAENFQPKKKKELSEIFEIIE